MTSVVLYVHGRAMIKKKSAHSDMQYIHMIIIIIQL